MNKLIKNFLLCTQLFINSNALETRSLLEPKNIALAVGLTGAGYFSWRLAATWLHDQAKKTANKSAIEYEIITRVNEITGSQYQLTNQDQNIIKSQNFKLIVIRGLKKNFCWQKTTDEQDPIINKPTGLMIFDTPTNFRLWHSFGPNFKNLSVYDLAYYTRSFDQNFIAKNHTTAIEPEIKTALFNQVGKANSYLARNPTCSAFVKYKKLKSLE